MQWHRLDRDRTIAMIDSVKTAGDSGLFAPTTSEAKCHKLSFYRNLLLYRLTNYASLPSFSFDYLGDGKTYFYLDGSVMPIYAANDAGHLFLDSSNVMDYLTFFFEHVSGPDGDIFVIDRMQDHPALDALSGDQVAAIAVHHQPPEINANIAGDFTIKTSMVYLGTLVRAVITVDKRGRVNVLDTQMLMSSSISTSGYSAGDMAR